MGSKKCKNCGASNRIDTNVCEYCGSVFPIEAIPVGMPVEDPFAEKEPKYYGKSEAKWVPFSKENTILQRLIFSIKESSILKWFLLTVSSLFCCFFPVIPILLVWAGFNWKAKNKAVITFILVIPMAVALTFFMLFEFYFVSKSDLPKFSVKPIALQDRKTEKIDLEEMLMDVRESEDEPVKNRAAAFKEKYEGRWIEWSGTVDDEVLIIDDIKVTIVPDEISFDYIDFHFDPLAEKELNEIRIGDHVTINGRIWGIYFLGDRLVIADGHLIEHHKGDVVDKEL